MPISEQLYIQPCLKEYHMYVLTTFRPADRIKRGNIAKRNFDVEQLASWTLEEAFIRDEKRARK